MYIYCIFAQRECKYNTLLLKYHKCPVYCSRNKWIHFRVSGLSVLKCKRCETNYSRAFTKQKHRLMQKKQNALKRDVGCTTAAAQNLENREATENFQVKFPIKQLHLFPALIDKSRHVVVFRFDAHQTKAGREKSHHAQK